ncbi:MAG TPA: GAF domain-containing protein [Candidatus Limnocylindrales bacterium]|nr:GAF domain-containing protein [Candidatus Limnocylindrales bacterium]
MDIDLERLVVRHRHVAPMLSVLLGATNAAVRISDAAGTTILEREAGGIGSDRFPIVVEGETLGWVEGDRIARAVAAVLSYAAAREADKRSLATEALDRYRELNLVYDLAEDLSSLVSVAAIGQAALSEVNRLPGNGVGFLLLGGSAGAGLTTPDGVPVGPVNDLPVGDGIVGRLGDGEPAIVNEPARDPRATDLERTLGAIVVAPLRARGHAIGVIGAATSEPYEYRASDLKVVSAIAALTGPAIEQARTREATADAPAGVG